MVIRISTIQTHHINDINILSYNNIICPTKIYPQKQKKNILNSCNKMIKEINELKKSMDKLKKYIDESNCESHRIGKMINESDTIEIII